MGEGFKKQKNKHLRIALLKSAVFGLSFGLFSACAVLLSLKLSAVNIAWVYYIVIGVGGAILCGGLTFLTVRPTDKKLAKQLDSAFAMGERTQTALEFAGADGEVVEIQRRDTDERLSALNVKPSAKSIVQFIVVAVLAIAVCLTSVIMPARWAEGSTGGGEQTGTDAAYSVTEEQLAGLNRIIENVGASPIDGTLRASVVALLQKLADDLAGAERVSQMRLLVGDAVFKTEKYFSDEYSYIRIANSLSDFNQYPLAAIIADGVRVYRAYNVEDFAQVEKLREEGVEAVGEAIEEGLAELYKALTEEIGNTPAEIYTALLASNVYEGDVLYSLLLGFSRSLAKDGLTGSLRLDFNLGLRDELAVQALLRAVKRYIIANLGILFNVEVPDDADFIPVDRSSSEDEDDKTNNGGYGDGSWKFNYEIYNPNTGEYENYMEILEEYFAIVDSMLREPEQFTEEQISVIRTYFEILFRGVEK